MYWAVHYKLAAKIHQPAILEMVFAGRWQKIQEPIFYVRL